MPVAENRLERLQVLKLLQSVRDENMEQIEKLIANGIPNLINFSGNFCCIFMKFYFSSVHSKQLLPSTIIRIRRN